VCVCVCVFGRNMAAKTQVCLFVDDPRWRGVCVCVGWMLGGECGGRMTHGGGRSVEDTWVCVYVRVSLPPSLSGTCTHTYTSTYHTLFPSLPYLPHIYTHSFPTYSHSHTQEKRSFLTGSAEEQAALSAALQRAVDFKQS
jgi:hypothetical protein